MRIRIVDSGYFIESDACLKGWSLEGNNSITLDFQTDKQSGMISMKMKQNIKEQLQQSRVVTPSVLFKGRERTQKQGYNKNNKHPKDIKVVTIKSKHQQPSKTSADRQESKHYNSPNLPTYCPSENKNTPVCTFAQLLQQQPSHPQLHQQSNIQSSLTSNSCFIKNENISLSRNMTKKNNKRDSQTSRSKHCHMNIQSSRMKETEQSRKSTLRQPQNQAITERTNPSNRSLSPKMKNPHQLNNTPKLQSIKEGHQNVSIKTFKALLEGETHQKKESINLLCSEKIHKFLVNEGDSKHKSNLQSTGIINLTHPPETENERFSEATKSTCQTFLYQINSKQRGVQPFSDDQSQRPQFLFRKLSQIQSSLQQIDLFLNNKLLVYNQDAFYEEINCHFNPEIDLDGFSALRSSLSRLSIQYNSYFSGIMNKIKQFSQLVQQRIKEKIQIIDQTESTLIDWKLIESQINIKDFYLNQQCLKQILSFRIDLAFKELNSIKVQHKQFSILEKQINTIAQAIEQQLKNIAQVSEIKPTKDKFLQFKSTKEQIERIMAQLQNLVYI